MDGGEDMTLLRKWLFWQAEGSVGGLSRAQVLSCLSPLAKSADTLYPHKHTYPIHTPLMTINLVWGTDDQEKHQPMRLCAVITANSSAYLCLFTSDSLIPSLQQFLFPHSLLLWFAPVHITGIYCMAPLKPNPQNGSRRASRVLGGGLPGLWKVMAHLTMWPPLWSNRWRLCFDRVPWGSLPIWCPPKSSKVM